MRDSMHGAGSDHGQPGKACFLVAPSVVRVIEGPQHDDVLPVAVARSSVLTQAQRDASAEGCRVPTSFTAEQISLWASYTRMPRVFMTQACLLHILAVLEVADMLDDARSVAAMCTALACDYLAPLEPESFTRDPDDDTESDTRKGGHCLASTAKLRARCKHPPPHLGVRHAFLWGAGLSLEGQLREVAPAEAHHCCRAAQAGHGHRHLSAAAHKPQAKPGVVLKALEALPEHLLLRVLRDWTAPPSVQLATLPRRLHPAAVTAAHPSLDSSRCISLGEHQPHTFRRVLRAVADLGSMRRLHSVTLTPPAGCIDPGNLRLVARHIRHVSAITSLHLEQEPRDWLGSNAMHELSCIAEMPHLRAVGLASVKTCLIPALVGTLTGMARLRELHLGVTMAPLLADGGWGGAAAVRALTSLTALEVVKLKFTHRWLREPADAVVTSSVVPLLRELRDKQVELQNWRYTFTGRRCASAVLGVLCAAAPRLDVARCSVEVSGAGGFRGLGRPALTALWRALTAATAGADAPHVRAHALGVGRDIDGMWLDYDEGYAFVPASFLGAVPGLRTLLVAHGEGRGIVRSSAIALTHELHKLTVLTELHVYECLHAVQPLLPRLSVLTALQDLHLVDHCMGSRDAEALAAGLQPLTALTSLVLCGNYLGEHGAQTVLDALAPAAVAGLAVLNLHRNDCGPGGAAAVAARLPDMTALVELNLSANVIGATGMRALQASLAGRRVRLTALTALDLQRNFLECSGAAALAHTLLFLPRLTALDAASNAIGSVGMRALSRGLMRMRQPPRLVLLSYNWFGDTGAQALAHAMKRRAAMASCGQTPQACTHACYHFECCRVMDAGALALAEGIQAWQASSDDKFERMSIYLRENEVSGKVRDSIERRLKRAHMRPARMCLSGWGYRDSQTEALTSLATALDV